MRDKIPNRFPDAPSQIRRLPVDPRGFPIPAFVGWLDGKRDFRVVHAATVALHAKERLCWICGRKLARLSTFVIGPMCAVNRISSEPPSHLDCARFAAQACPFLTEPRAVRNDRGLPEHENGTPGVMLERNPGVTLLWTCRNWHRNREGLFELGEPSATQWFCQAREATRAEVMESVQTGLPSLLALAKIDGPDAVAQLAAMTYAALEHFPAK
jgi:hypothetical protein